MPTFISDRAEWERLSKIWRRTDVTDQIASINRDIDHVNALLSGVGLAAVPKPSQHSTNSLMRDFEDISRHCREIHKKVMAKTDDLFSYKLAKTADAAYSLSPRDITVADPSGSGELVPPVDLVASAAEVDA